MTKQPANESIVEGQVIDDRYKILGRLGVGGIGTVFKAERLKVGRVVAIKFLKRSYASQPGFRKRFEREALAMSRLYHLHCVSLIDHGVHKDTPYLAMEYVPGKTLSELLASGPLEPGRAIAIMRQLLSTLGYFHERNVVHRDLKTDNVMLMQSKESDDFVKLLDFGMAKLLAGMGAEIDVSIKGTVVGTPSTMSPEQIRDVPIDGRSDLYSAGVLLYQMIVGRKPFQHKDTIAVMRMHLKQPPPPPRTILGDRAISEALEAVMLKALAKNRDQRFQSAEEMSKALAATPEGRAGEVQSATPTRAEQKRWQRLVFVAALGWSLFAVLLIGVVIALLAPETFHLSNPGSQRVISAPDAPPAGAQAPPGAPSSTPPPAPAATAPAAGHPDQDHPAADKPASAGNPAQPENPELDEAPIDPDMIEMEGDPGTAPGALPQAPDTPAAAPATGTAPQSPENPAASATDDALGSSAPGTGSAPGAAGAEAPESAAPTAGATRESASAAANPAEPPPSASRSATADAAGDQPSPTGTQPAWSHHRARARAAVAAGKYREAMGEIKAAIQLDGNARTDPEIIATMIETLALPQGDAYVPYVVREFGQHPAAVAALIKAVPQGGNWYIRHHALMAVSSLGVLSQADRVGMWLADLAQAKTCRAVRRSYNRLAQSDDPRARQVVTKLRTGNPGKDMSEQAQCLAGQSQPRPAAGR